MTVLIADDEAEVLKGLKRIVNWEALGFSICGEAQNGTDALERILILRPDLVLLDIRMPRMTGLEIIQTAKEHGYTGHWIILSGYSEFSYAQTAVSLGVDGYLLKPVDEDELADTVRKVHNRIQEERENSTRLQVYRSNARLSILSDLITGRKVPESFDLQDLHLDADQYRIVICERYDRSSYCDYWELSDLLNLTSPELRNACETVNISQQKITLLRGSRIIRLFSRLLEHYKTVGPQEGSALNSMFLICGRIVQYSSELPMSYEDTCKLLAKRFFCEKGQHILTETDLPQEERPAGDLSKLSAEFAGRITAVLLTRSRLRLAETLHQIEQELYQYSAEANDVKQALIDLLLRIRQNLAERGILSGFPFPGNAEIMKEIPSRDYLYEIIQWISEQFSRCMDHQGADLVEDIRYYILHNYQQNLRLENIAPLFGYNVSYLGKLFTKKTGESFNGFLDQVRVEKAKELLRDPDRKIYEVAELVGWSNVDYFCKKFRKITGITPSEFRKEHGEAGS